MDDNDIFNNKNITILERVNVFNISILEDDPVQLDQLKADVQKICQELKIENQCRGFKKTATLQESFSAPSRNNVYILDLEIDGDRQAGLELSQKIREHDRQSTIIFITVHEEFVYRTYKYRVSALDFIAKDYDNIYDELKNDLQQVRDTNQQIDMDDRPFIYQDYSNQRQISFSKINYIESNPNNSHSSILNTVDNEQLQINYNLRRIEQMDNRFFRVHRSFLINPSQVKHVDTRKKLIKFFNGQVCPVSRIHINALLNKLH